MSRSKSLGLVFLLISSLCVAQSNSASSPQLPRLIRYSGVLPAANSVAGVTFALYGVEQGGSPLWLETQNVSADATGHYSVLIGAASKDGLPGDLFSSNEARWLGVKLDGLEEQRRVLLVSVPYALKAGDAETLGGRPASAFVLSPEASNRPAATTSSTAVATLSTSTRKVEPKTVSGSQSYLAKFDATGTSLINSAVLESGGYVGINTAGPVLPLDVQGGVGGVAIFRGFSTYFASPLNNGPVFSFTNNASPTKANWSFGVPGIANSTKMWIYDNSSNTAPFQIEQGSPNNALYIQSGSGYVGVGTPGPVLPLDVQGGNGGVAIFRGFSTYFASPLNNGPVFSFTNNATPTKANWSFGVPGNANATKMWIYDNSGNTAPFQIEQGAPTNAFYIRANGSVGVGTSTGSSTLTVGGKVESTGGGFKFPDGSTQIKAGVTNASFGSGVTGSGTPDVNGNITVSADYNAVQARVTGTCSTGTALGAIAPNGTVTCNSVSGTGGLTLPFAGSGADNPPTTQGVFKVTNTAVGPLPPQNGPPAVNTIPSAIVGVASGSNIVAGVVGEATQSNGVALVAVNTSATSSEVPVVFAWSQATSGAPTLFNGQASSASAHGLKLDFDVAPQDSIAVMVGPDGNRTEIFSVDGLGNVFATGNINAGGNLSGKTKTFKIDDPLDPAHKWLYHTSMESPDMKNLYDGVVALDAHGEAWVTMPEWFGALNRDFRYQLTAIGAAGPKLFIAQEISGNRFKIAGGKRGMKVSWQVTGIRQDAWAADNRNPIEQDKVGTEVGQYYHPKIMTPANSPEATAAVAPVH